MAKSPRRKIVDFAIRALPDAIEDDARRILGLEVKPATRAARKALPAPPKPLALPAPGPGLPPQASKPRGGQWWVDKPSLDYGNSSPEEAARRGASDMGVKTMQWVPDDVQSHDAFIDKITSKSPEQQWLERALTKYYKNEFGSPDDPLRSLAERGLHYDPEMTPEKWQATVNSYLMEDPIQQIMFPPNPAGGMPGAGSNLRGETMAAMPWLAKVPATDKVYGISGGGLDLGHFTDEFYNALNPEASGLPMSLAVRPESLDRMTFAQAAEHVGKINQYRVKEMERAALSALDSPAVQTFKEYADDNPLGLRWTELKAPDPEGGLPEGWQMSPDQDGFLSPEGEFFYSYPGQGQYDDALQQALKYEGDTMGHCVGGYCDDVLSGRSRIFSLRDAKGEPHVTVETAPGDAERFYRDRIMRLRQQGLIGPDDYPGVAGWEHFNALLKKGNEEPLDLSAVPQNIIQIKGKQNRAPTDDYRPFVQDFVKSGQWDNVGDLSNTGLVRLPDGRYLTHDQMDEIIRNEGLDDRYQSYDFNARGFPRDPAYMDPEDWAQFQRHFEGFAIGGRVDPDRCFCHNPLSVKKGR